MSRMGRLGPPVPDPDGLNLRQRKFVEEYVVDGRPERAARRAGYITRTAAQTAAKLLSQANVKSAIERLQGAREIRTRVEADRVLLELARIAFFDPRLLFDENDSPRPPSEWPDEVAACVASVEFGAEVDEAGVPHAYLKRVRFWNKNSALDSAMKHLGLLAPTRHEFSGPGGGPVEMELTDVQRRHLVLAILSRISPTLLEDLVRDGAEALRPERTRRLLEEDAGEGDVDPADRPPDAGP